MTQIKQSILNSLVWHVCLNSWFKFFKGLRNAHRPCLACCCQRRQKYTNPAYEHVYFYKPCKRVTTPSEHRQFDCFYCLTGSGSGNLKGYNNTYIIKISSCRRGILMWNQSSSVWPKWLTHNNSNFIINSLIINRWLCFFFSFFLALEAPIWMH